jgi:hypothetical protein
VLSSVFSLMLLALARDASMPAVATAPTLPGVVAELRAGVGAPLGPVGLAVAVPFERFSAGGGLGVADVRLHEALFGRVALIQGRRLRISFELGWSGGSTTHAASTLTDFRLSSTRGGNRYDATLAAEVGVGPTWLGLQGGVGYLDGTVTCWQQNLTTSVFMPCDPGASPAPSAWLPFVALSLRHRDQADNADGPDTQTGAASRPQVRIFLAGTQVESTDVFSDGHFDGDTSGSGSIDGELVWPKGRFFRYGIGLRYEVARVSNTYPDRGGYDHFVDVPVLLGAVLPLAGANQLELMAGLGVGAGLVRGGSTSDRSNYMRGVGPMAELTFTYWIQVARGLDLSLGVAMRASALAVQNGADYFRDGSVLRGVLPLRLGVRWSL